MTRSSKQLAKRLRFLPVPRPDRFRRHYRLVGVATAVAALALWWGCWWVLRERQYLPGPVSADHASFGHRCAACHPPFRSVRDETCLGCHEVPAPPEP